MIPSKYRLRRGKKQKSAPNGRFFSSDTVSISMSSTTNNSSNSKFTVVVSKKIIKTAVARNLLKRRVYSVISHHLFNIKPGVYMVYIKKEAKSATYKKLKEDIGNVFKKI
ncbi:MAG TPA: ribonuclease P protein component [Candidatus Kaiserbacteria bacterium]|nr:ribonuclease P protein component [Candidatus Kaiserbacteria bacterium]